MQDKLKQQLQVLEEKEEELRELQQKQLMLRQSQLKQLLNQSDDEMIADEEVKTQSNAIDMKLYRFQQTKDLEAVCELISMEERFEQKYSIETNFSLSFNEQHTQKQQNKLSKSIFNQNDILSNLQEFSIRRSMISVKSDISLEDNDYHPRASH